MAVRFEAAGDRLEMYFVDIEFDDGTAVRAMSPAAYKVPVLQQRIIELRRAVGVDA